MMHISLGLSTLIVLALLDIVCSAGRRTDVLFVVHDAGESLGLQPVIDNLITNSRLTAVTLLTLGSPASTIYEAYPQAVSLSDLGITTDVVDGEEGRLQLLPVTDIDTMLNEMSVATITCGMAYAMQAQICEVKSTV